MGEPGSGAASCARHAEAPAVHYCSACNENRCANCAQRTWFKGGFVNQCDTCGGLLQGIGDLRIQQAARELPAAGAASFVERLPDMLLFPFQRSVLIMILGLALITAPLGYAAQNAFYLFGPYGFILGTMGVILVLGFEAMVFFHIIVSTSNGDEAVDAPSFGDLWEDMIDPVFLYLAAALPIVVAAVWWGESHFHSFYIGLIVLATDPTIILTGPQGVLCAIGIALLPLLTAIAALSRSYLSILNPLLWIESLRIMWATYPVAAACYYAVWSFEVFVYRDVLFEISTTVEIPLVTRYAVTVLGYLPMVVTARLLGAMCEPYLGDFE